MAIYRAEMPIIGGLKLYYLVSSVLGDAMDMGRDKFLNLLHRHKLIIPPRKTHHAAMTISCGLNRTLSASA